MTERATSEAQVFDIGEAVERGDLHGRIDMAQSPDSYIAVFHVPPRGGETSMHQHPDSDQILFVLKGECTVDGLSGKRVLGANQGVLIPAGVHYGFTNTAGEDLIFLSMRTEQNGGRRVAYVPNVSSDVAVEIPEGMIEPGMLGHHLYLYCMDRHTIGISARVDQEWNAASVLRMNCEYQRIGGGIQAFVPERAARWYQLTDLRDGDFQLKPDASRTRVEVDLTPMQRKRSAA